MGEYGKPGFLHLNANNRWPGFNRRGLELDANGILRLFRLPRLASDLPATVEQAPAPTAPSAVAVSWDGSVYYTDDRGLRLVNGCSGDSSPSLGVAASGLATLAGGTLIAINDPANARVLLLDAALGTVVEIRGGIDAAAIASDEQGNLYASAAEENRTQRFDRYGVVRWESSAPLIERAVALAVAGGRVFALGQASGVWQIVSWRPGDSEPPRVHGAGMLQEPAGLAATADAIYVGDNSLRRILKISVESDSLAGAAVGYRGPVGALAIGLRGRLYVHPGGAAEPLYLGIDAGCAASGVLWGKVKAPKSLPVTWHRAHASVVAGDDQSHFQFFAAAVQPADSEPVSQPFGPTWRAKGLDVGDFFAGAGKSVEFWLGLHMFSDGSSTPELSQIKVDYDQPTYLAPLPPVYRDQGVCGDFLLRYLTLFESFFAEGESEIRSLPELFDPEAAPADALPWLGSWLALAWDEGWNTAKQRETIRTAFDFYGRRGTVAGLREALASFAGVRAVIQEPIQQTGWWGLPSPPDCTGQGELTASILGSTSAFAAAEPQGAVLGVSAALDRSHLIRNEDYGKPLFEQTAHQFSVIVYSDQPDKLAKVREILDREKPAHTSYQICIVEPRMRIGQQARVGVDAVVAGTPRPGRSGDAGGLRLGGEPAAPIGGGARVGTNIQL